MNDPRDPDLPDHASPPESGGSAMTPEEARRLIAWWVEEGELKDAERQLLLMHLRAHPESRAELEALRHLDARLRDALRQVDTSPDFTRQVLSRLPAAQERDDPAWMKDTRSEEVDLLAKQLAEVQAERAGRGRRGRGLLLPAGLALLILSVLSFNWMRGVYSSDPAESAPVVARYQGHGVVLRGGEERDLDGARPRLLKRGDIVEARNGALTLELENNHLPVATVHLGSGAQLKALNRHQFKLLKGEAYFAVRRDRPRGKFEVFDVDTPLGHVQVLGTVFGIVVPSEAPARVAVVVDEGRVKLQPLSGAGVELTPGEEAALLAGGGVTAPADIAPGRLAWVRTESAPALASNTPPDTAPVAQHIPPKDGTAPGVENPANPGPPAFDWNTPVQHVDFRGLRLPEALERLRDRIHERVPNIAELQILANQAAAMPNLPEPSRLVVRRALPTAAVLRWLAREQGLRFEDGLLRAGRPGELWGPPEGGLWKDMNAVLCAPLPEAVKRPDGGEAWITYLHRVADRTGVTLALHPTAFAKLDGTVPDPRAEAYDMSRVLKAFARDTGLAWCEFDGAVLLADIATVEDHTRLVRGASVDHLIGKPLQPAWARTLMHWVDAFAESEGGALDQIALQPRPMLKYRCGYVTKERFRAALTHLEMGSPACIDALHALDEHIYRGPADEWIRLVEQVRTHHIALEAKVAAEPLTAGALDNKSLPLGRLVAWAARLRNLGVHLDGERYVLDTREASFGAPQWQAVRLEPVLLNDPDREAAWPEHFIEKLRTVYPVRFAPNAITLYPLNRAVLFFGDREALAAAQRLRDALRDERKAGRDPWDWQPAARAGILENLAQPYKGMVDADTLPAAPLRKRLRGSGRFFQLRATLIIDPDVLQALDKKALPELPVKGKTLGEVLEATAAAAGLKMYVEDDAVWLRPAP